MIAKTATFLLILALLSLAAWQLGRAGLLAGKAWAAPILIERAWEEGGRDGTPTLPWPWADSHPTARIEVPGLDVTRYVLDGDNMRNLAFGPVLAQQASTTVLFGHRDTHFRFLKNLLPGQELIFQTSGAKARSWRVSHSDILAAEDLAIPASGAEENLLLVTCYPFDAIDPSTDLRYVVWLQPEI